MEATYDSSHLQRRGTTVEDEDGLDAKFFERSQVGLDARREGKRKTSGGGKKWLP